MSKNGLDRFFKGFDHGLEAGAGGEFALQGHIVPDCTQLSKLEQDFMLNLHHFCRHGAEVHAQYRSQFLEPDARVGRLAEDETVITKQREVLHEALEFVDGAARVGADGQVHSVQEPAVGGSETDAYSLVSQLESEIADRGEHVVHASVELGDEALDLVDPLIIRVAEARSPFHFLPSFFGFGLRGGHVDESKR